MACLQCFHRNSFALFVASLQTKELMCLHVMPTIQHEPAYGDLIKARTWLQLKHSSAVKESRLNSPLPLSDTLRSRDVRSLDCKTSTPSRQSEAWLAHTGRSYLAAS